MGTAITDRITALIETLRLEDIDAMPPAKRERFAQLCSHWGAIAATRAVRRQQERSAGVLADLRRGQRHE
jgi:hypothetical protein